MEIVGELFEDGFIYGYCCNKKQSWSRIKFLKIQSIIFKPIIPGGEKIITSIKS